MDMKIIFSRVKLNGKQILELGFLVLLSAIGEMMLPFLLAQMINTGVVTSERRRIFLLAVIMILIAGFECIINLFSV